MSQNFYPCGLRSGQFRNLPNISLWGNMKMLPVWHKPIETTQFFQDHGQWPLTPSVMIRDLLRADQWCGLMTCDMEKTENGEKE